MKKRVIVLVIMMMLSLCACSTAETVYTVVKDDVSYVVDRENQTISDGTHTYQYEFSGNTSNYNIDIVYPNGSTYWFNQSDFSGYGGWSDDYDEEKYVDGDTLCDVLLEKTPKEVHFEKYFAVILFAAVGIFQIASPYTAWYLGYGWRYKNAEPSDTALVVNRVMGVFAVIIAIILLFV